MGLPEDKAARRKEQEKYFSDVALEGAAPHDALELLGVAAVGRVACLLQLVEVLVYAPRPAAFA